MGHNLELAPQHQHVQGIQYVNNLELAPPNQPIQGPLYPDNTNMASMHHPMSYNSEHQQYFNQSPPVPNYGNYGNHGNMAMHQVLHNNISEMEMSEMQLQGDYNSNAPNVANAPSPKMDQEQMESKDALSDYYEAPITSNKHHCDDGVYGDDDELSDDDKLSDVTNSESMEDKIKNNFDECADSEWRGSGFVSGNNSKHSSY